MVSHSYVNSSAQWLVAAVLDTAHAEGTFLSLRKVLTAALWFEGRNVSDKKKGIWERSPVFSNRNKPTCQCKSERQPKVVTRSRGQCQTPHPQQLLRGAQPQTQVLLGAYLGRKVERWRRDKGGGSSTDPPSPLAYTGGHPGWTGRVWGGLLYPHVHICALGSQPGREIQPWSRWTRTDPSAQSHASYFVLTFC